MCLLCNAARRLWDAAGRKLPYLFMGALALTLMVLNHFIQGWSWRLATTVYLPYVIVSLWHFISAFGEGFWSLDAKVNEDASKILRDNVSSMMPFIILIAFAGLGGPDAEFRDVMKQMRGGVSALLLVYTWLGVVRAVLATRWVKRGNDEDIESVIGVGEAGVCASTSCEPALVVGSGGHGAAVVSLDGGQSDEGRTSAAAQGGNKDVRDWRMLATGVAIGVLASDFVVWRLRRN